MVLANGCYDPLHIGHVRHLRAAKALGDVLIVSLTADEYVNKPGRPIFKQALRKEMLRELRCVDDVMIVCGVEEAIGRVRPDIFVKGKEYEGKLPEIESLVQSYGGRVVFTNEIVYSSTRLVTGGYFSLQSPAGGRCNSG